MAASDKVYVEMETDEGKPKDLKTRLSKFFWHGGSVYDAWFSCASKQVAQVLLTLPYSFYQLGILSGILLQLLYGLMGSWTAYLISIPYAEYRTRKEREKVDFRNHVIQWFDVLDGLLGKHWRNVGLAFNCTFLLFGSVIQLIACASNIYYINDNLDKRTWTYIFGASCATTVFIPSFHNYIIWSFLGLVMTTYTAWYLTVASILHGRVTSLIYHATFFYYYFTKVQQNWYSTSQEQQTFSTHLGACCYYAFHSSIALSQRRSQIKSCIHSSPRKVIKKQDLEFARQNRTMKGKVLQHDFRRIECKNSISVVFSSVS